MCAVLMPFFKLLAEYTGFQFFTLLCGAVPEAESDDFPVAAVHFGRTAEACPRNFSEFNPRALEQIFTLFTDFLSATRGMC